MNLLGEVTQSASLAVAGMTDETIKKAMPDGANIADLSCTIVNGVEVYSYKGVPFIELHPVEFKMEGNTLRMSRKWRAL